jgi:hypothetical protein
MRSTTYRFVGVLSQVALRQPALLDDAELLKEASYHTIDTLFVYAWVSAGCQKNSPTLYWRCLDTCEGLLISSFGVPSTTGARSFQAGNSSRPSPLNSYAGTKTKEGGQGK